MHSVQVYQKSLGPILALAVAAAGCASATPDIDDRFDPDWMTVVMVEQPALSAMCGREDRLNLTACARPNNDPDRNADSTVGRGTCNIYIARALMSDGAAFDYVLRHEAKHCRGWRHFRD